MEINHLTQTPNQEELLEKFAGDINEGLSLTPKKIPSVYFYDQRGSELFKKITELPEYYLTRCENEILLNSAEEISDIILESNHSHYRIIELGAGDSEKPFPLIREFFQKDKEIDFTAVDISPSALSDLSKNIARNFPDLQFEGLVAEYNDALQYLGDNQEKTSLLLFLGSNIGNFKKEEKVTFLQEVNKNLNPGDFFLIGFDQKKPLPILQRAYDDPRGITKEFNLNLLDRMNRQLGANFKRENFSHYALYNDEHCAMESFLVSKCDQEVYFEKLGRSFTFSYQEPVHTEFSHKYNVDDIYDLADESQFQVVKNFFDSKEYFACSLWKVMPY